MTFMGRVLSKEGGIVYFIIQMVLKIDFWARLRRANVPTRMIQPHSMNKLSILLVFWSLFAQGNALAAACVEFLQVSEAASEATVDAVKRIMPGSPVAFKVSSEKSSQPGVFLGRTIAVDGKPVAIAVFDESQQVMHFFPEKETTVTVSGGAAAPKEQLFPLVESYLQSGPTCAAYAMFNCFRQLELIGAAPEAGLEKKFETETSRLAFLAKSLVTIYGKFLSANTINSESFWLQILKSAEESFKEESSTWTEQRRSEVFAKKIMDLYRVPRHEEPEEYRKALIREMGLEVMEFTQGNIPELKAAVLSRAKNGFPIVIGFSVPERMSTTPYTQKFYSLEDFSHDRRVWLPKTGRGNLGGRHSVIPLAAFKGAAEEPYLLVSDANVKEPRLWSLGEFDKFISAGIQSMTPVGVNDLDYVIQFGFSSSNIDNRNAAIRIMAKVDFKKLKARIPNVLSGKYHSDTFGKFFDYVFGFNRLQISDPEFRLVLNEVLVENGAWWTEFVPERIRTATAAIRKMYLFSNDEAYSMISAYALKSKTPAIRSEAKQVLYSMDRNFLVKKVPELLKSYYLDDFQMLFQYFIEEKRLAPTDPEYALIVAEALNPQTEQAAKWWSDGLLDKKTMRAKVQKAAQELSNGIK